jgi:predicted ATPase
MQQKIVIIGGPGTGKSTLLNELISRGFHCMPEISREVIKEAQEKGIEQLFLTDPLLFSNMLLEGREKQYQDAVASKEEIVFFDRGIPDAHAYMNYSKTDYPAYFVEKSKLYQYSKVFMLPPWKEIFVSDNERYESFEIAVEINHHLIKTYKELGYKICIVPFGSVKERTDFILNSLKSDV